MSALENVFGYAPEIWRRFNRASHAGTFDVRERGVLTAQAGSPAAKSLLRLQLKLEHGVVQEARFKAYGCPSAIAVGEWLAEQAVGKTPQALGSHAFTAPAIRRALEIADDRAHCALMGEDVIKALLQQMQS